MFRELSQSDFARVRPLFHALAFQPFCTAVLAGLHPGRIFVDDVETPQTACMIREDGWSFLAGEPNNTAFNQALHTAIWERAVIDEDTAVMLFTCEPPAWRTHLPAIFAPRKPVSMPRRHYLCQQLANTLWNRVQQIDSVPKCVGKIGRAGI